MFDILVCVCFSWQILFLASLKHNLSVMIIYQLDCNVMQAGRVNYSAQKYCKFHYEISLDEWIWQSNSSIVFSFSRTEYVRVC